MPRMSIAVGKKKEEVDNGPLFQRNNLKHQRDIDEHKLKVRFYVYHTLNKYFYKLKINNL